MPRVEIVVAMNMCMKVRETREFIYSLSESLDELKEDFDLRRRPCCAIRKMATKCMEKVNIAYSRFIKISEYYEFDENYSIVPRTDKLFRDSVDLCVFFGV